MLHVVKHIASGPGTGDDLSAVRSAGGGGRVCLGTAAIVAPGPGGKRGSAAKARKQPPPSGPSLLAQVC